jgi:hypothetical protein
MPGLASPKTPVACALLAGAIALLAACGGKDRLSAAEFRQQADAICAKYQAQLDAVESPSSVEEVPAWADKAIPIIENGNDELNDLEPPEEFEEDFDRALEINEENLEIARDIRAAAEDGDEDEVEKLLGEAGKNDEEGDRIATKLGLEDCGRD